MPISQYSAASEGAWCAELAEQTLQNPNLRLVIAPNEQLAYHLEQVLSFWLPAQIGHFPDYETLPYEQFSPHSALISARMAALARLPQTTGGVMIVSAESLLQKLPPTAYIHSRVLDVKLGQKINLREWRESLQFAGYNVVGEVRAAGEYAVRGSVIDLAPMGQTRGVRLELFDDEIDSLRLFDPETQLSLEKIDSIQILPAREFPLDKIAIEGFRQRYRARFLNTNLARSRVYESVSLGTPIGGIEYYLPLFFSQTANLLEYLPKNTEILWLGDSQNTLQIAWENIEARYQQLHGDSERPLLPPDEAFFPPEKIINFSQKFNQKNIIFENNPNHLDFAQYFPNNIGEIRQIFEQYWQDGWKIRLSAESAGRREQLISLLQPIGVTPAVFDDWVRAQSDKKKLGIFISPFAQSFRLEKNKILILTESAFFGARAPQMQRRRAVRDPETILRDLTDLALQSPVVHQRYGVGRYQGLMTLESGGETGEFLHISYTDGSLYVPITELSMVHRYSGQAAELAPHHAMSSRQRWERDCEKAARRVQDVAAELLLIQAKRESQAPRARETIDENLLQQFGLGFRFELTPDQASAIEAIQKDLSAPQPMDRVVCGDVGFGKTEVALRAAAMRIFAGKQVCLLAPTTLLAQQHYQTFLDRFADFPVKIACLSRLRTAKEQNQSLKDAANGQCDIVIGTHRLLQDDVVFKNLGLVIVDEEHRFGVKHKEQLKKLRAEVDLLTLTATPIPRTLNMAMSGLRQLSLITTPPPNRLAVRTFVQEKSKTLLKEAITREIRRGGQVYYLHNEVRDMPQFTQELSDLIPEAKVRFAHGQMNERELEQVMLDFYHQKFNVLISTTIIESGIDVPTANTILIDRADKLGLAQLHQLRGRVGRSHHAAYAYLLTPPPSAISSDARKRLEAIASLHELGAGFMLATHDMEIRGAGELLGDEQSGRISEIGFTMYADMLARAIKALKAGHLPDQKKANQSLFLDENHGALDLNIPALLPADYIPDVQVRLVLYKRLSLAQNSFELDQLKVECIDRFGLLPIAAKNLFLITELQQKTKYLGIQKIELWAQGGKIIFSNNINFELIKLIQLLQSAPQQYRLEGQHKLHIKTPLITAESRLKKVDEILAKLG